MSECIEHAATNHVSQKWIDKLQANASLLHEILGPKTPVSAIDYDRCNKVRSLLARIPANRGKRNWSRLMPTTWNSTPRAHW
jgi:hypothetical protein